MAGAMLATLSNSIDTASVYGKLQWVEIFGTGMSYFYTHVQRLETLI